MDARTVAESQSVISVRDLVLQRRDNSSTWNLALVQRDEVWDEVRMRQLLDSLLAGYPIGAILLSQVEKPTRELKVGPGGERPERAAAPGSWQVLDGQQRINALFSIFTEKGRYGRFLLDVLTERPEPAPAQRRRAKIRSVPHIKHIAAEDEEVERRERFIDLARWSDWAESRGDLRTLEEDPREAALAFHDLDPRFALGLGDEELEIARHNLTRILRAWRHEVPLLRARLESPLDVLEVFTRINLGGVNIAGDDVFFAGVKTFWNDAEHYLDVFRSAVPVLGDRLSTLRFLSRMAARGLGQRDILPLSVERLAGRGGMLLREALSELASPQSRTFAKLHDFSSWYVKESGLGHALRQVQPALWDDVLIWVAAAPDAERVRSDANRELLDSYLLGGTIFGYRQVMGDTFRRLAFSEALAAGAAGEDFPLHQIVAVARAKTELKGGRGRAVLSLQTDADLLRLANSNGRILASIAQQIEFDAQERDEAGSHANPDLDRFDWDHIYPQAQAHRMSVAGDHGRRLHHKHRHLVNSSGNLWALAYSANRGLGKRVGRDKFDQLEQWAKQGAIWSRQRWAITPQEVENFVRVDELLNDPLTVDEAMEVFRVTVEGRARRLLDEARERYPLIEAFAADPDGLKHDPTPLDADYHGVLGIETFDAELRTIDSAEAWRRLRRRAQELLEMLRPQLDEAHGVARTWVWPPSKRTQPMSFACFELSSGNCIELLLRWDVARGAYFEYKAYPKRKSASKLYPDFDHLPLGLPWSAPDLHVAERFRDQAHRLESTHPRS